MMAVIHLEELSVKRGGDKRCNCKRSAAGEAMDGAQDDLLYAKWCSVTSEQLHKYRAVMSFVLWRRSLTERHRHPSLALSHL
jgi:hypothetical protein